MDMINSYHDTNLFYGGIGTTNIGISTTNIDKGHTQRYSLDFGGDKGNIF